MNRIHRYRGDVKHPEFGAIMISWLWPDGVNEIPGEILRLYLSFEKNNAWNREMNCLFPVSDAARSQ
jgi:hypothetical protein